MSFVTKVFNRFLDQFFEPVGDDFVKFDFNEGLNVKNLVIKPEGINKILQTQDVDVRMDHGHVGSMRIVWTAFPGIATLQIRDLDIRLRPNLAAIASREIGKKIDEIRKVGEDEDEDQLFSPTALAVPPTAHPYFVSPNLYQAQNQHHIHDTTATRADHCKIPRPPRIIRRAQYVNNNNNNPQYYHQHYSPTPTTLCQQQQQLSFPSFYPSPQSIPVPNLSRMNSAVPPPPPRSSPYQPSTCSPYAMPTSFPGSYMPAAQLL
eukprot:GHVS01055467.1.p1 GENE.GHVS01055467.1~~GHVS01055467.1.p1  ORF type:complete len:262 (+),score=42.79 GHVS01055467.1:225-1010(+)